MDMMAPGKAHPIAFRSLIGGIVEKSPPEPLLSLSVSRVALRKKVDERSDLAVNYIELQSAVVAGSNLDATARGARASFSRFLSTKHEKQPKFP
jgi:hypothetical protein